MSRKVQFTLVANEDLEQYLHSNYLGFLDYRILSESLDARGASKGNTPKIHYSIELCFAGERFDLFEEKFQNVGPLKVKPIIIGTGPAGLFCALRLLEYGIPSILLERGDKATQRMLKIGQYWRKGVLDPDTNVCYGEGGAGLFSDV